MTQTYAYVGEELTSVTDQTGAVESYTYDRNGSTTEVTNSSGAVVATYTYDPWGRMTGATANGNTVSYTYDPSGERTSETVNGATTTYLNDPMQAYDQVLEEYAPGGVLAATYIRGLDLLFQQQVQNGV